MSSSYLVENCSMPRIRALNRIFAERFSDARGACQAVVMPRAKLSAAQRSALAVLRLYKILISPMFGGSCRFLPSCSDYAAEAVTRLGVLRGSWLAARRLARCHPLGGHGLDAVPSMSQKPRY